MRAMSVVDRCVERFTRHGFECVIGMGGPFFQNFNGYIRVPAGHPWHGLYYDACPAECHGGLTYCGATLPWEAEPLNPSHEWWFGFDTCHCFDEVRGAPYPMRPSCGGTFKDMDYVRAELEKLADQVELARKEATSGA